MMSRDYVPVCATKASRSAVIDIEAIEYAKLVSVNGVEILETHCAHPRDVKNCFDQSNADGSM